MVTSCFDVKPLEQAGDNTPYLDVKEFFNGKLDSWGVVYDWRGRATKLFTADLDCSWKGDEGKIKEVFHFSDNSTLNREWFIKDVKNETFEATASDVKGIAVGKRAGKGVQFKYDIIVETNGKNMTLSADDYMLMFKDGTGISRIKLKKFGIPVGEIIIHIKPAHKGNNNQKSVG
jgi:hypothetical protein